ncbi:hypothetical protein [Streptomyces sp. CB02460]|uniref:hypothetical protein n=1 Tax=Streptomyces sp. CB02460 TaxID=1703941 RepID=UPI00093A0D89|nr:hypothetical protein [Streptomyces sp. CB02460]OKJ75034.1 hypothetical protein AMK30_12310 [Streptomyces sp. CB02460]
MRGGRLLSALLPVLLLATGCGIRATDVVEAGEPATVEVASGGRRSALVYFVSSSSASRLMPVVRTMSPPESVDGGAWTDNGLSGASAALYLLFQGPTRAERDSGLRSELPTGGGLNAAIELSSVGVKVTIGMPVTGLSEAARQQLVCTAAAASTADRTEVVTVIGTEGVIGPTHCAV